MAMQLRISRLQLHKQRVRTLGSAVTALDEAQLRGVEGGSVSSERCRYESAATICGCEGSGDPTIPSACFHTCSYSAAVDEG